MHENRAFRIVIAVARHVAAVVGGLLVATLLFNLWTRIVEAVGIWDSDVSPLDPEFAMRIGPATLQLTLLAGWAVATMIGAGVAFRLSRSAWTGWLIAAWISSITMFGVMGMYPHPRWLILTGAILPWFGAALAFAMHSRYGVTRGIAYGPATGSPT